MCGCVVPLSCSHDWSCSSSCPSSVLTCSCPSSSGFSGSCSSSCPSSSSTSSCPHSGFVLLALVILVLRSCSSSYRPPGSSWIKAQDTFARRHIGPSPADQEAMLKVCACVNVCMYACEWCVCMFVCVSSHWSFPGRPGGHAVCMHVCRGVLLLLFVMW